jgi:hypothetical protein
MGFMASKCFVALRKYIKRFKQERFYNAELLCEEVNIIFTECMQVQQLKIMCDIFV